MEMAFAMVGRKRRAALLALHGIGAIPAESCLLGSEIPESRSLEIIGLPTGNVVRTRF
jgi:hypothetical protein